MASILSEVFKCILYILGIVSCISLIRTMIMLPVEKKKREQIEKQRYEEAKEKFQQNTKELGEAMKELFIELEKVIEEENIKNSKKTTKKTRK